MYSVIYPQTKTGTVGTQCISWSTVGNKEKIHSDHPPSLQTRQVRRQNIYTFALQTILLDRQQKKTGLGVGYKANSHPLEKLFINETDNYRLR